MRQLIIQIIAFFFIAIAVALIILEVTGINLCSCNYIEIASTLGTLAGAILIFSTLEMQRKSLNVEKHKNEIERFNSRFYPILSSFRTDASNMEIIGDCLSSSGIGTTLSRKGEKGFAVARSIIKSLKEFLEDNSIMEFDKYEFDSIHNNYSEALDYINQDSYCPNETDKIEKKQKEHIKANQVPYLVEKWGITKDDRIKYQQMDSKAKDFFLLNTLIDHQSETLNKYIQSLRFILHIIYSIKFESERGDYYQQVLCLIGKEELAFLKCFSEFNLITNNNYGQK